MDAPDSQPVRPESASLADFDASALARQFAAWGYKPSHAARVLRAFYAGDEFVSSTARKLPEGLAERLHAAFAPRTTSVAARQVAADGTIKLLLRLRDGRAVESVQEWRFVAS